MNFCSSNHIPLFLVFLQMTSAPFRVTVIPEPPTNHLFILDVDHSYERLVKDPDILCAFAEKLANSLGDRGPKNLVIRLVFRHFNSVLCTFFTTYVVIL